MHCIKLAATTGIYVGQEGMRLGTRYIQYTQFSYSFCSMGPCVKLFLLPTI